MHLSLRFPFNLDGTSNISWLSRSANALQFKYCKLIIVDEISMVYKDSNRAMDAFLSTVMGNRAALFGGKTVVFAGVSCQ